MPFYDFFMADTATGYYSYTAIHWVSFAAVAAVAVALALVAGSKRISCRAKDATIISVAAFQLVFEVGWRILYLFKGNKFLSLWPFYPCNVADFLLPIALLIKNERMKDCFYLFGFMGGVITFVYPVGIFITPYLQFSILKSILQHTGIIFIPVFEYVRGTYRPRLEKFGYILLGLIIHVANSYGLSTVFGYPGDYMYLDSGLPFVIPGIPQFITMGAFAVLILFLVNWALDYKGVSRILQARKAKGGTPIRNDPAHRSRPRRG